jgi:hypothetical protein
MLKAQESSLLGQMNKGKVV